MDLERIFLGNLPPDSAHRNSFAFLIDFCDSEEMLQIRSMRSIAAPIALSQARILRMRNLVFRKKPFGIAGNIIYALKSNLTSS
jgi:hypothetical protein